MVAGERETEMAARGGIGAGRSSKNVALVWLGWVHTTRWVRWPRWMREAIRAIERDAAGWFAWRNCLITTAHFNRVFAAKGHKFRYNFVPWYIYMFDS